MRKIYLLPLFLMAWGLAALPALAQQSEEPKPIIATYVPRNPQEGLTPIQLERLAQLMKKAEEKDLWNNSYWHTLLRYQKGWFGGVKSQADSPVFFFSPQGKTNPKAELEANVAAFFMDKPGWNRMAVTPQCAFPARYRWLKEQLEFNPIWIPEQTCPEFEYWRKQIDIQSVTFIYSSFYINSPVSAFGHTFVRLDNKKHTDDQRLMDRAINFAAAIPEEDTHGVMWVFYGLFGGYPGVFSQSPYYMKVLEYSDSEKRDLWEYRLNFTQEENDRVVAHLWEMQWVYFDYYFFDENCSYHMLPVLEAARPGLNMRDHYLLFTLPTDTVRDVATEPGLVSKVTYRPSRLSQMKKRVDMVPPALRSLADDLAENPALYETPEVKGLDDPSRIAMLDAAVERIRIHLDVGEQTPNTEQTALRQKLSQLLLFRSQIPVASPPMDFTPWPPKVEEGHKPSRLALSGGGWEVPGVPGIPTRFTRVSLMPVFQEMLSDDRGYAENSQVIMFHLQGRYDEETKQGYFEKFDVLDVISLVPLSSVQKTMSWQFSGGWHDYVETPCPNCLQAYLKAGFGYALQSHAWERETFALMGGATLNAGPMFDQGRRADAWVEGSFYLNLAPWWRMGFVGSRIARGNNTPDPMVNEGSFRQRLTLSQNWELRTDVTLRTGRQEASAGLGWWF
ncbi:MAG: DUF4105 domain-containing protein [Deltaproteobacteria bacterium]|nr:DUF4105 domain-containing protein [Deltaproteobacteria bacterium]